MRKLLFIFLMMPVISHATAWQEITSSDQGKIEVASDSVSSDAFGRKLVWAKTTMYEPMDDTNTQVFRYLNVVDCESKQVGRATVLEFDGDGDLLQNKPLNPLLAEMLPPDPDMTEYKIMNFVCKAQD